MSVEDKNVVDFVSIAPSNNKVMLSISDHLEWDEENEHIIILQDKINAYISFIESGDVYEKYPQSEGKSFAIELVLKYKPNEEGYNFLNHVKEILEEAGYGFEFKRLDT